ncbi:carbon-monoxide dehydrogenase medium subunit [Tistlia consotensis]|uniref:Carbon-monoxide dehydrogenase medium subunit n=1 Tax=Tistlia consotensis USBA 355 TaxID=560819 RepID=A0A1Y6C1Q1_9PROT|nr:FAD binding domain-containing protein [Tistlia consotensis]SMF37213.1 carbon-monoxide dehydrogenase medium subunit [Tistlia consotensis USBA 355]SNR72570.1 carbon-monoxide dehydrogenase medium subunit [Tistlia consotensis]
MKPAPFDYSAAGDLSDARRLLAGGAAKPVSGSQSLGPMLNLRLARPGRLVDVSALPELRAVAETAGAVTLGAAITHAEIEDGEVPDPTGGWLREAAGNIAYRAVRNRGTLGGSLAHADPAADWLIVMTGLGATAIVEGPQGRRRVAIEDFAVGPFVTALGAEELLVAVEVPRPGAGASWGYWKFARQVGEFAKASAAVLLDRQKGRLRCAVGALGRPPLLLGDPEGLIEGQVSPAAALRAALPERPAEALVLHVTALTRALAQARGGEEGR